jgi:hypothetical protein
VLLFFRNIQFTTAISLALYVGLLHFAAISGQIAPTPPMADAGLPFESLFGWLKDYPFWSAVGAASLVFIQALIINGLADAFRLMTDRNWLPGMSYALVASALPDFQFLSPPLVAATFIIFSLRSVFLTYKSPKSAVLVFDAALWIAVSSLFYPKALLLIVALFIAVGVMRSWNARDQFAFFCGIFVPVFLGWLSYFWSDSGAAFRSRHWGELIGLSRFDAVFDLAMILKCVFLGFLLLLFLVNFSSFSRNKSMQGQKCVEVLYWVFFIGAGAMLLRPEWRLEAFVLTAAPAGIFLAMSYQNLRNSYAEGLHFALLCFVLLLQYFPL